jgi:hypothetical protein
LRGSGVVRLGALPAGPGWLRVFGALTVRTGKFISDGRPALVLAAVFASLRVRCRLRTRRERRPVLVCGRVPHVIRGLVKLADVAVYDQAEVPVVSVL